MGGVEGGGLMKRKLIVKRETASSWGSDLKSDLIDEAD
jgi:hypothetical protein